MSKFWSEVTMVMDLVTWLPGPVHVVTMNMVNVERCFNLLDDTAEYWFEYAVYEVRSGYDAPIGLSGK
jgi:hypothetical protein